MLNFALPLWVVPSFLDYTWHRRTKIETTSGTSGVDHPRIADLLFERERQGRNKNSTLTHNEQRSSWMYQPPGRISG
jgi:hypothetical protein